jgi:hypothetical protein
MPSGANRGIKRKAGSLDPAPFSDYDNTTGDVAAPMETR